MTSPSPSGVASTATARTAPSSLPKASARADGLRLEARVAAARAAELAVLQVGDGEAGQRRCRFGERRVDARAGGAEAGVVRRADGELLRRRGDGARRRERERERERRREREHERPRERLRERTDGERGEAERPATRQALLHGQPPLLQSTARCFGTAKPTPTPVAIAEAAIAVQNHQRA